MEFKKVEIEDFDILRSALREYGEGICDFSAGNLVFWRNYYKTSYCLEGGALAIRFGDLDGEVGYWCGKDTDMAQRIIEHQGGRAHFCCLSESEKEIFEGSFCCEDVDQSDNWSDYIYNSEDIMTLSGKRFNGQRNHINKFCKLYPDYTFSKITPQDAPDIIEFCKHYFENVQHEDKALAEYEEKYIAELMHSLELCPQLSGVLRVKGKVVGFSVGETVGDYLIIHIEKADVSYPGAYPMIVKLFAQKYAPGVKYINREEDCGVAGLRTSKLSYHPCGMLKKYSLWAE